MRGSRTAVLVLGVVMVLGAAACEPAPEQLEIDFTIRNTGTVSVDGGGRTTMTLSGVLACSKGTPGVADGEHLDLFTTLGQGSLTQYGIELHDHCSAPRVWNQTFEVDPQFAPGTVRVEITACTNPGELVDEDCTTDTDDVTLRRPAA